MVARNKPRGPAQAVGWPSWKSRALWPGFGPATHTLTRDHADQLGSLFSLCVCGSCDREATSMADADDVRRLALALPHVEEIDSDGFDFRVAGKGFVWSYPERRPGKP